MRKAFELKDRASEREKLAIQSDFYQYSGQIDKAIASYDLYKQSYPRDTRPRVNQGVLYLAIGQWDKGLQDALEGIRLDPNQYNAYDIAATCYIATKRLDDAKAISNQALQRKIGGAAVHEALSLIALAQGDPATAAKEATLARAFPQGEFDLILREAGIAARHGQLRHSFDLNKQIEEMARKLGFNDGVVNAMAAEALTNAMVLNNREATRDADAVLKLSQTPTVLLLAADIYARTGEDAKAEKLIGQAISARPDDQFIGAVVAPMIRAVLALNHHDSAKALEVMKVSEPYNHSFPESMYTHASALQMSGNGAAAAQEFQRVIDLEGFAVGDFFVAMSHLGLARNYAAQGDKAKARTAYQDFLGSWKNADSDLPLLKQVQAEYAKLQ
jgi:tetratricopeptide (TPR) repeat protein